MVVLPDIIGNGDVHMPLQRAMVGNPPSRTGVEVDDLAFFASVAAALPGVHRALIPGLTSGQTRLGQTTVAIEQQSAGQLGQAEGEEREDKEFIPENMPPIGFAVEAARRDADIEVTGMRRRGLEQMESVQA